MTTTRVGERHRGPGTGSPQLEQLADLRATTSRSLNSGSAIFWSVAGATCSSRRVPLATPTVTCTVAGPPRSFQRAADQGDDRLDRVGTAGRAAALGAGLLRAR